MINEIFYLTVQGIYYQPHNYFKVIHLISSQCPKQSVTLEIPVGKVHVVVG